MSVLTDESFRTIVVYCTDCPAWSEIVTTGTATAERLARFHAADVHPGENAVDALNKRNQRDRVSGSEFVR